MTIPTGSRLNYYEIITPLGAGGMGEVYLAEDTRLRRRIALKVLPDSLAQNAERLRRFEQEAFAASALNHPNILTIYEFGAEGETHFLAAEFIDGETLRARLERAPLSLNETLDIGIQTAQALAAAHAANIIHRDIKPENVMLRKDGIVKVLDFGLAKLVEAAPLDAEAETRKLGLTQAGTVMGTVAYMSPEQARGQTVDARTDIFSLGVMLYEMLAQHQPFTGETVNHVIVAILEKEPPPLTGIPAELTGILEQALAKRADERYESAQAMLADLKKLQTRLLVEAENKRNSSDHEQVETQTLMLQQTTAAASEASTTAAGTAPPTAADKPGKQKWWIAAVLSLVALAGGFFGYRYFTTSGGQIDSLAVLPFQNRSGNADSEYLSDGLAESLIYQLSQLPDLKVSPTSSVFRYKGRETDPQTIGRELDVQAVMTGRLTQRGEKLTLSVELVDVRNNKTLWGEQYERKLSELLTTQREMATEITSRLQLKLSGADAQGLQKRYTNNDEAYQLYLRGQYHFARRSSENLRKAISFYQQAISRDPHYALAYVGIAQCYNSIGKNPEVAPREAIPQAKNAARRALEIDPMLAEAHAALADSLAIYDWNWAEAEHEYKRALELNPNNAYTHLTCGISYLFPMGRTAEAMAELKRAVELEPLSLINNSVLVTGYLYARQNAQAIELAQRTYDLDPNFAIARFWLCNAWLADGKVAEAMTLNDKALQSSPSSTINLYIAGLASAKAGRRKEAEQRLAQLSAKAATEYVRPTWTATVYAALGDKDQAFAELEKGYVARDCFMPRLKADPLMDPLRDDPRFKAMLKRLNLPE